MVRAFLCVCLCVQCDAMRCALCKVVHSVHIVFTNVELLWSHIVAHFTIKYLQKLVSDDEKIER